MESTNIESVSNQPVFTRPYFLAKNEEPEGNYILFRKIIYKHKNKRYISYLSLFYKYL